jgi:hypothetical protein
MSLNNKQRQLFFKKGLGLTCAAEVGSTLGTTAKNPNKQNQFCQEKSTEFMHFPQKP